MNVIERLIDLENVSDPLGEAPHDVRPAAGLGTVVGLLAARHPSPRAGDQLGPRPRVGPAVRGFKSVISTK